MSLQPTLRIASSTGATVINTTTETTLFSLALPGGSLAQSNWGVRFAAHGTAVASSSAATLTLRLKTRVGSSTETVFDAAVALSTSTDSRRWQTEAVGLFLSTGSQDYRTRLDMGVASTSLLDASTAWLIGGSTGSQTGTGSVVYALTAAWSAASTNNTVTGLAGSLDLSR